jgi:hypothetical protein
MMYGRRGHGLGWIGKSRSTSVLAILPTELGSLPDEAMMTSFNSNQSCVLANIANHSQIFFTPSQATSGADMERDFPVARGRGATADYAVKPAACGWDATGTANTVHQPSFTAQAA